MVVFGSELTGIGEEESRYTGSPEWSVIRSEDVAHHLGGLFKGEGALDAGVGKVDVCSLGVGAKGVGEVRGVLIADGEVVFGSMDFEQ